MTERERWAWENMVWGGSMAWQLQCVHDAILVVGAGGRPRIIYPSEWSPDYIPMVETRRS